jgi:hypothetical protein
MDNTIFQLYERGKKSKWDWRFFANELALVILGSFDRTSTLDGASLELHKCDTYILSRIRQSRYSGRQ